MSNWVAEEMVESQLHDRRHAKRLTTLLTQLSEQPVSSIPRACQGWAETMAVYRFLDNPQVGFVEILSGQKAATLERVRAHEVALLVQDTSFLNYGTLQAKAGMGTVRERTREEYLLHATLAFTLERVNLGVVGAKLGSARTSRWRMSVRASRLRRKKATGGWKGILWRVKCSTPVRRPWWSVWPIAKGISRSGFLMR